MGRKNTSMPFDTANIHAQFGLFLSSYYKSKTSITKAPYLAKFGKYIRHGWEKITL